MATMIGLHFLVVLERIEQQDVSFIISCPSGQGAGCSLLRGEEGEGQGLEQGCVFRVDMMRHTRFDLVVGR